VTRATLQGEGRYRLATGARGDVYTLGARLSNGSFGVVHRAVHGAGALRRTIAVKVQGGNATGEDEARMHARVFCSVRRGGAAAARALAEELGLAARTAPMARIPRLLFVAVAPAGALHIGMGALDVTLATYAATADRCAAAVRQIAALLAYLQDAHRFLHGDLKSNNVMVRQDEVFLIDFGYSGLGPRGARLGAAEYNDCTDLLMLLTELTDFTEHGDVRAWCYELVRPFWEGLATGAYGTGGLARDAVAYVQRYGPHAVLYSWKAGFARIRYPPTRPRALLRRLRAAVVPRVPPEEARVELLEHAFERAT
jgi:hypothetical protein